MTVLAKGDKVRVAMVGAGVMANNVHYPSLASFPDVEFAGICDLRQDRLSATADKYGIEKRYMDYQKMIEEIAPDAVYVIGQPDVMYPHLDVVPAAWPEPVHRKANGHHPAPGAYPGLPGGEARLHHPGELPAPHPARWWSSCARNA